MLRDRLFWKQVQPVLLFAVALAFLPALVVSARARTLALDQVEQRLRQTARMVGFQFEQADRTGPDSEAAPGLQQQSAAAARAAGVHVKILSASGTILADSSMEPRASSGNSPAVQPATADPGSTGEATPAEPPGGTTNAPGDSEQELRPRLDMESRRDLQQARSSGYGRHVDEEDGTTEMTVALRIGSSDTPRGYVLVREDIRSAMDAVHSVRNGAWGTSLAVMLVGIPLLLLQARRRSEACTVLIHTAREISSGNMGRRSTVEHRDELGVLSTEFNRMMTILADRLDQEQAHSRQLQAGSDRLTTVLGAMIEGVIAVDEQHKILFANRAARRLLDLADEDCEGRLIWATIRITAVHDAIRDVFAGEPHRQLEFELTRRKATVSMLASRLPGTPCPGLVLVLHDITDLRRLENMRREFVSNVSHELKTPLTSIRAFTETLLEGAVDDPDHNRRFLQRIEGQSERLSLLIQDLLNLARIESGRESFDVVPLRVADSVRNCIDARQPVAAGKGVELKVGSSPQDAYVSADSDGLRTILDNLISNAINYTPPGGRIEVRWRTEDGRVLLQVQDTGVGIPPEHHARIFERFYRVDKARSREVGGTGLGLSIVKHLLAVFNGTIKLESAPGSGSTFTVSLPAAPRRREPGQRPEA